MKLVLVHMSPQKRVCAMSLQVLINKVHLERYKNIVASTTAQNYHKTRFEYFEQTANGHVAILQKKQESAANAG